MRMCNQCAHYHYAQCNGQYTDVCDAYEEPVQIDNCMHAIICRSFIWRGADETPINLLKNYDLGLGRD